MLVLRPNISGYQKYNFVGSLWSYVVFLGPKLRSSGVSALVLKLPRDCLQGLGSGPAPTVPLLRALWSLAVDGIWGMSVGSGRVLVRGLPMNETRLALGFFEKLLAWTNEK